MNHYSVLDTISHNGKTYKAGDVIALSPAELGALPDGVIGQEADAPVQSPAEPETAKKKQADSKPA